MFANFFLDDPVIRVEARDGSLAAVVNADRGAKIASLTDSRGREWLAQASDDAVPPRGTAFVDAEMSGWDECAPTIVACRVGSRQLPDHGELWTERFEECDGWLRATPESGSFHFARRIRPMSNGLALDYCVDALVDDLPFLWAAHPQFRAGPGTIVDLVTDAVVDAQDVVGQQMSWTPALASIDHVPVGGSRKYYVPPTDPVSSAAIRHADGSTLAMSWTRECPYLGIWFDACAFSREPVIALEPTTSYFDSLAQALAERRTPILRPGAPLEWSIFLRDPSTRCEAL